MNREQEASARRHTLVWADPGAWAVLCRRQPDTFPSDWAALERPLIVRRALAGDVANEIPLGLPLPLVDGKRRVMLTLPHDAIVRTSAPPLLSDLVHIAPHNWSATLEALAALDSGVAVFGSLAWEFLTGAPYLSPTSDVDLLWPLQGALPTESLLAQLRFMDVQAPMRLDGEIVRSDGWGVNWRELASEAGQVLAKGSDEVKLFSRKDFIADR